MVCINNSLTAAEFITSTADENVQVMLADGEVGRWSRLLSQLPLQTLHFKSLTYSASLNNQNGYRIQKRQKEKALFQSEHVN